MTNIKKNTSFSYCKGSNPGASVLVLFTVSIFLLFKRAAQEGFLVFYLYLYRLKITIHGPYGLFNVFHFSNIYKWLLGSFFIVLNFFFKFILMLIIRAFYRYCQNATIGIDCRTMVSNFFFNHKNSSTKTLLERWKLMWCYLK